MNLQTERQIKKAP